MATFTVTIPDAAIPRLQAAFQKIFGLEAPPDAAFVRAHIIDHLKSVVKSAEAESAMSDFASSFTDIEVT